MQRKLYFVELEYVPSLVSKIYHTPNKWMDKDRTFFLKRLSNFSFYLRSGNLFIAVGFENQLSGVDQSTSSHETLAARDLVARVR